MVERKLVGDCNVYQTEKLWESTLMLVVEDDAQDGVDHVDGHRTVALAISPYIKRGSVDSTFYSQPSMLKTIELILRIKKHVPLRFNRE
jgi:hypothetical protein